MMQSLIDSWDWLSFAVGAIASAVVVYGLCLFRALADDRRLSEVAGRVAVDERRVYREALEVGYRQAQVDAALLESPSGGALGVWGSGPERPSMELM